MTNFQITDSNGEVTFDEGTALDGDQDNVKVIFQCFVGDNNQNLYKVSEYSSNAVNFYNTAWFTLYNDYSRSISANQPFETPPKVKVVIDNDKIWDYTLTAQIYEFDFKKPGNPELFTQKYMSGYMCNIKFPQSAMMATTNPTADGCTITKISDDN